MAGWKKGVQKRGASASFAESKHYKPYHRELKQCNNVHNPYTWWATRGYIWGNMYTIVDGVGYNSLIKFTDWYEAMLWYNEKPYVPSILKEFVDDEEAMRIRMEEVLLHPDMIMQMIAQPL